VAINAVSLPFAEQIEFFRRKLNLPTQSWTDIYSKHNDWAFVVAGANRNAIVSDFRTAIEKVIAEGGTLADFRKDFDTIVAKHGWSYNGGRNWRSRVIYETNLNSSYMAGRHQQMLAVSERRPFWRYVHSGSENPRHDHLSWNNLVLRHDNPWWQTHYPTNGWGCDCRVQALNERDIKRMGLQVGEAPAVEWETREIGQRSPNGSRKVRVPKGIDPGFEHVPGQSRLESAIPPEVPFPPVKGSAGSNGLPNTRPQSELPAPRNVDPDLLLPTNLSPEQYATEFLTEFGATLDEPAVFSDVIGERLVIGKNMFTTARTGEIKADKNGRGQFMKLLASALKEPDEIWVRLEYHFAQKKTVVRRRYVTQIQLPGSDVPTLAVFEYGDDGWSGVTAFVNEFGDINDLRIGVRLYRREE
jgi:hypothetical protein